jgi:hypothetical protein
VLEPPLILDLLALEHLKLNVTSTVIRDYFVGDQDVRPSAPKLRTLEVSGLSALHGQESVLSWIEGIRVAHDLESVVLVCRFHDEYPPVRHLAAFLHERRPAFRRLVLKPGRTRGERKFEPRPSIAFFVLIM